MFSHTLFVLYLKWSSENNRTSTWSAIENTKNSTMWVVWKENENGNHNSSLRFFNKRLASSCNQSNYSKIIARVFIVKIVFQHFNTSYVSIALMRFDLHSINYYSNADWLFVETKSNLNFIIAWELAKKLFWMKRKFYFHGCFEFKPFATFLTDSSLKTEKLESYWIICDAMVAITNKRKQSCL